MLVGWQGVGTLRDGACQVDYYSETPDVRLCGEGGAFLHIALRCHHLRGPSHFRVQDVSFVGDETTYSEVGNLVV